MCTGSRSVLSVVIRAASSRKNLRCAGPCATALSLMMQHALPRRRLASTDLNRRHAASRSKDPLPPSDCLWTDVGLVCVDQRSGSARDSRPHTHWPISGPIRVPICLHRGRGLPDPPISRRAGAAAAACAWPRRGPRCAALAGASALHEAGSSVAGLGVEAHKNTSTTALQMCPSPHTDDRAFIRPSSPAGNHAHLPHHRISSLPPPPPSNPPAPPPSPPLRRTRRPRKP